MVRCMAEGANGQDLRNHIVEAMWEDVNVRKTKLEVIKFSAFPY